jgi:hypothetical protein
MSIAMPALKAALLQHERAIVRQDLSRFLPLWVPAVSVRCRFEGLQKKFTAPLERAHQHLKCWYHCKERRKARRAPGRESVSTTGRHT